MTKSSIKSWLKIPSRLDNFINLAKNTYKDNVPTNIIVKGLEDFFCKSESILVCHFFWVSYMKSKEMKQDKEGG